MGPIEKGCAALVAELARQGKISQTDRHRIEVTQVTGLFRTAPLVRAVLNAVREPDEIMQRAGGGALARAIGNDPTEPLDPELEQALMIPFDPETDFDPACDKLSEHATKVWQAMLDDALDDASGKGGA